MIGYRIEGNITRNFAINDSVITAVHGVLTYTVLLGSVCCHEWSESDVGHITPSSVYCRPGPSTKAGGAAWPLLSIIG